MNSVHNLSLSGSERVRAFLADNPVWLAPMAGVNDAPFRAICKQFGAGLTYTEMVSAKGLHYGGSTNNSQMLLRLDPTEVPCAVQLFGAEPELMAAQALALTEQLGQNLAFIDINMGCPVAKVVNKGEGSALMLNPESAVAVVSAIAQALKPTGVPVTVKMRRGWDETNENAVEFALAMEDAGASAVAVHGRYREQFYKGTSDSSVVAEVKKAISIPVIGSGDIMSAADAVRMFEDTGVDGVMVARGAMGNPWIFRDIQAVLSGAVEISELVAPSVEERFAVMIQHALGINSYFGNKSLVRMRKHVVWYCAGLPGASHFRGRVNALATLDDLTALIEEYASYLSSRGAQ